MATNLLDLVPTVYSVGSDDARLAIELFEQYAPRGVKARDLIHVAVMRRHGLTRVISTDEHVDQVAGIERLDPENLWREAPQRQAVGRGYCFADGDLLERRFLWEDL